MSNDQNNIIMGIIEKLIDAENKGKSEIAEPYLSTNFIAITRSSGVEENRDELIKAIESATGEEIKRELDKEHFGVSYWEKKRELDKEHFGVSYWDKIAVSRSLITLKEDGKEDKVFRNIHVFDNKDGKWLCKMWQVTKLEKNKDTMKYKIID